MKERGGGLTVVPSSAQPGATLIRRFCCESSFRWTAGTETPGSGVEIPRRLWGGAHVSVGGLQSRGPLRGEATRGSDSSQMGSATLEEPPDTRDTRDTRDVVRAPPRASEAREGRTAPRSPSPGAPCLGKIPRQAPQSSARRRMKSLNRRRVKASRARGWMGRWEPQRAGVDVRGRELRL